MKNLKKLLTTVIVAATFICGVEAFSTQAPHLPQELILQQEILAKTPDGQKDKATAAFKGLNTDRLKLFKQIYNSLSEDNRTALLNVWENTSNLWMKNNY